MKKYLSIGEVSKIKGVSIKSLRYYGELGILPPAYINEETGYRYYSVDQLVIVDLIVVCLDLEIPLKNFKAYILEDGLIDIGKLLQDGQSIVAGKIKKIESSVAFLDAMNRHTKRAEKIKNYESEFIQHIPKRFFLVDEFNGDMSNYLAISTRYTKLLGICKDFSVTDAFNQGTIFQKKNGITTAHVFLEIPQYLDGVDNLVIIEENDFICNVIKDTEITTVLSESNYNLYILKELYDLKIKTHTGLVEVQRIL
jgi:DNA-binding transcriptional MerR regulator